MQAENDNRRAAGVRRVGLSTVVEICGRAPGVPAFEAESVEVSGRGMHVRTKFLPELHAPLVMRFEHDDREVVVEGEVAWRQETDHGGDFGIKFTALDSSSVGVLKQLCAPEGSVLKPELAAPAGLSVARGSAVKLHIGGLGAPMKARVFDGGPRKLNVGSQLEFLRVGRSLELEDVTAGAKRGAHIESVSIVVDPETHVPQLVVSLRYEGEEVTPEPSVVDGATTDEEYQTRIAKEHQPQRAAVGSYTEDEDRSEDFDDDEAVEAAEALFRSRVEGVMSSAGHALKSATARARVVTASAAGGVNALVEGARRNSGKPSKTRRTSRSTASARVAVRSSSRDGSRQLRPQHRGKQSPQGSPLTDPKRLLVFGGALAVFLSGAYVLFADDSPEQAAQLAPPIAEDAVTRTAVSAPSVLAPGQFPPPATLDAAEQAQADRTGIVAQVPLFGATPMATVEAAPVTPPPVSEIDEYSLSKDQAFSDKVPAAQPQASPSTEGETQWQVGRLHLPVIHRLRLDAPGTALQGEKTATGFTVVIPGRQVKENGAGIASQDDRITQVRVKNTPAGGKVMFRFQKEIPGYKVRLRNDFVEFFINSPLAKK